MAKAYIDYKTSSRLNKEAVRWQLSLYRYLDGQECPKATFRAEDHSYWLGDKRLISVTQLLKKHNLSTDFSKVNPEVLQAKAERGTLIHEEIEHYIKTGEVGFTIELYHFLEWQQENNIKPVASEIIVNNDLVAGTVDLIAEGEGLIALHLDGEKCTPYYLDPVPDEEIERLLECEHNGEIYQPRELIIPENTIQKLYNTVATIKQLKEQQEQAEATYDALKELITKAMKQQGIKSFENFLLKMTYIAPSVRETIDTKKLKEEQPDIAKKYAKKTKVKETVKITLKGTK
jgi:hypothetical protein